jgi:hypothetical protein
LPLSQAQDSVGVAHALASSSPALTSAVNDAFLAGLQTSCVVIGVLCLVGAVASFFALPGRIRPVVTPSSPESAPTPALEPA